MLFGFKLIGIVTGFAGIIAVTIGIGMAVIILCIVTIFGKGRK